MLDADLAEPGQSLKGAYGWKGAVLYSAFSCRSRDRSHNRPLPGLTAPVSTDMNDKQDCSVGMFIDWYFVQTLQSLDNRLKWRRTGKQLHFRAPPAAVAETEAIIATGQPGCHILP